MVADGQSLGGRVSRIRIREPWSWISSKGRSRWRLSSAPSDCSSTKMSFCSFVFESGAGEIVGPDEEDVEEAERR